MGDDSTPIGYCQEADGDAQRAPGDGDDGHFADGGAEHVEEVLLDVMGDGVVNAETESVADEQVQHLNHFYSHQSFLIFFLSQSFFYIAYCLSIRLLEALLVTLLVMWGR
jgi:hypothetical protein